MLYCGCASCDITTRDNGVKINDPLYAKVFAFDTGKDRFAVVSMDCIAIGDIGEVKDSFLPRLRSEIHDGLGIDERYVMVSATHTHVPGKMICDEDTLVKSVYGAVAEAFLNLEPVKIGVGYGYDDSFIINRTLKLKDGSYWSVRQAHPLPSDRDFDSLDYADARIPILRIDRADGSLMGVIFNFGCHPLVGLADNSVSAQYPGFAASFIEETSGCDMAMFLSGCSGDVTEVTYKNYDSPKDCRTFGISLGFNVLRALKAIETSADMDVKIYSLPVTLPRRFDMDEEIAALNAERDALLAQLPNNPLNFKQFLPLYLKYQLGGDYPLDSAFVYRHEEETGRHDLRDQDVINRKNIDKYLSCIEIMEKLSKIQSSVNTLTWHKNHNINSGETTASADVFGIKLGDECAIVTAPFEALSEIGRRISELSPFENTILAAYANGYMHYGAPSHMYRSGGYETIECMLDASWQPVYEKTALEVLTHLYNAD